MKLFEALGDSPGWFGAKTYADNWNDSGFWTLVGNPGDVASVERPSSQGGISEEEVLSK